MKSLLTASREQSGYEQGLKRATANLDQMERYDKVLGRWEEQAKRMDAILEKIEKDHGLKQ